MEINWTKSDALAWDFAYNRRDDGEFARTRSIGPNSRDRIKVASQRPAPAFARSCACIVKVKLIIN
ncbi:MAG: hypothetical protein H7315_01785 [Herminiimonas sp.]|nr:hypothetical protein [Herminiimonas sp.]